MFKNSWKEEVLEMLKEIWLIASSCEIEGHTVYLLEKETPTARARKMRVIFRQWWDEEYLIRFFMKQNFPRKDLSIYKIKCNVAVIKVCSMSQT